MPTVGPQPAPELNIREQIARIDSLLMDTQKEQRVGGAAAIFAAGAAIVKLIVG
ncbi:MAG: hypothetical protein JWO83_3783 [Caulobacteraceae bacterium]|nr:hypothetical protein [Caulobacteraceae bacterium]